MLVILWPLTVQLRVNYRTDHITCFKTVIYKKNCSVALKSSVKKVNTLAHLFYTNKRIGPIFLVWK